MNLSNEQSIESKLCLHKSEQNKYCRNYFHTIMHIITHKSNMNALCQFIVSVVFETRAPAVKYYFENELYRRVEILQQLPNFLFAGYSENWLQLARHHIRLQVHPLWCK